MKKVLLLTIAVFFLGLAPTSFAQVTQTSSPASSPTQTTRTVGQDRQQLLKSAREQYQKRREELKTSLKQNIQKLQDTKKQQVIENIDERIANRNDIWVKHWNEVLSRLTSVLDKAQTRTTTLSSSGKDITTLNAAIASARTAIANAQVKVDAQESKTYEFVVDTQTTVGANIRGALNTFQTDVKAVIASLNEARRAVATAITELKKLSV